MALLPKHQTWHASLESPTPVKKTSTRDVRLQLSQLFKWPAREEQGIFEVGIIGTMRSKVMRRCESTRAGAPGQLLLVKAVNLRYLAPD